MSLDSQLPTLIHSNSTNIQNVSNHKNFSATGLAPPKATVPGTTAATTVNSSTCSKRARPDDNECENDDFLAHVFVPVPPGKK